VGNGTGTFEGRMEVDIIASILAGDVEEVCVRSGAAVSFLSQHT
jgi:hypothetical protein